MSTTIPLNRVIAFAGPYLSVVAGGIATWLIAKVNIAGIPGLDQDNLQTTIASGLSWLLVTGLSWAGQAKWLRGHQIDIETRGQVDATAMSLAVTAPIPDAATAAAPASTNGHAAVEPDAIVATDVVDEAVSTVDDDGLPGDDEEFGSPPPPVTYTPAEPVSA
jgi:hypothetical protein